MQSKVETALKLTVSGGASSAAVSFERSNTLLRHGHCIGVEQQHRKCSGVDLTFFLPRGSIVSPKSDGGPSCPHMSDFGKSKISMKTSLLDQSLPGVHRGGVGECCTFFPEKKKSKLTPHGPFFHPIFWRENPSRAGELNIRSDN